MPQSARSAQQHVLVQRFLRREVVQQARPADPDLVGDLGEARGGEAVIGEATAGHLDDQLLGPCPAGRRLHGLHRRCIRGDVVPGCASVRYFGARARRTSLVRSGAARIIGIGVVTPVST